MTLTEFLLARIAEDEAVAERGGFHNGKGTFANDNYGCLLVQPSRVLAECEAKRAIIALHEIEVEKVSLAPFDQTTGEPVPPEFDVTCNLCGWVSDNPISGCDTQRALALPYADHEDYRDEWKLGGQLVG